MLFLSFLCLSAIELEMTWSSNRPHCIPRVIIGSEKWEPIICANFEAIFLQNLYIYITQIHVLDGKLSPVMYLLYARQGCGGR